MATAKGLIYKLQIIMGQTSFFVLGLGLGCISLNMRKVNDILFTLFLEK